MSNYFKKKHYLLAALKSECNFIENLFDFLIIL